MAWQYVATILDAKGALEETLDQVAPGAEDDYSESETSPLYGCKSQLIELILIGQIPYQHGYSYH